MNGDKSVEEIKKTAVGAAKEAVQEVKESVEATAEDMENVPEVHLETPEADVEVTFIDDRDKEAEGLIHWAAARAGVIVAAPLLGTVSLIANEVYMISKIGSVYGVDVPQKAVLSFIGSLGATVVGTTIATLLPIPFIQIPIGISVTYGLGKAAVRWIKDGMKRDERRVIRWLEKLKKILKRIFPLAMKREILRKKLKRQLTMYILKKRMKLWINWQTSW